MHDLEEKNKYRIIRINGMAINNINRNIFKLKFLEIRIEQNRVIWNILKVY